MTREQIERASATMKESQNYHMSFEDAQDYISKCGFDIPWNDGDVFVDEREITRTVGNVLKWRINSVWHNSDEEPEERKEILVEYRFMTPAGEIEMRKEVVESLDDLSAIYCDVLNWAYLDDLLPEREEETE